MSKLGKKVLITGDWKGLEFNDDLRNQGLAGIEELTNYSLSSKKKTPVKKGTDVKPIFEKQKDANDKKKKKKKKPAKNGKINQESEENVQSEIVIKASSKKRKRQGKEDHTPTGKNKKQKKSDQQPICKTQEPTSESTDDEEIPATISENSFQSTDLPLWKDLFVPAPVLQALKELHFEEPTPIQRETLPAAIKGRRDVVGAAETGSGKTLAFAIPILHGILLEEAREAEEEGSDLESEDDILSDGNEEAGGPCCVKVIKNAVFDFDVDVPAFPEVKIHKSSKLRALVLTPTRELAIQVKNHFVAAAKYTGIQVAVVVGGMSSEKQERLLKRCPEIVVATPGRLWDLIQTGNPHLSQVTDIKYLAIDETDRMVEKGHFDELQKLLELINADETKKSQRQNFVFSATLTLVHQIPKHLMHKKAKLMTQEEKLEKVISMIGVKAKPKIVDLTRKVGTAETLTESCIHCTIVEKDLFLYYFLKYHPGRTIIFCNSIDCVRRLVNLFTLLQCHPMGLHAQMHQKQRLKSLERFEADSNGVLIATDVAARGLDIPDVEHVVHYQVPRTSESYIHRSGRTARASKEGLSVMFIDSSENNLYKRMCKTLNRDEELPSFPVDSTVMPFVKERLTVARELDKLMLASKKEEVQKSWRRKAAEEADLVISDESEDEAFANSDQKSSITKSAIQAKKAQLQSLLAVPLYGSGFSGKYVTMMGKLTLPNQLSRDEKMQSALTKIKTETDERKRILKTKNFKGASVFKTKNKPKKGKKVLS